jgi:4-hydroxybenzoate polyprenyltransferase
VRIAILSMLVLLGLALGGGLLLGGGFVATVAGYFVLNVLYTYALKRIAYVDVLCITAGFELRVLAGSLAIGVQPSAYLVAVMGLLATFLGFGKRMHELRQGREAEKQRAVLAHYDERALNYLLAGTGTATVALYATYTLDAHTRASFGTSHLVITTAFTAFGVWRFLHLVRNRPDAESPTEQMLRDPAFLVNLVVWAGAVLATIYLGSVF